MTNVSAGRVLRFLGVTVLAIVAGSAVGARGAGPATQPSFRIGHVDDPRLGELSGLVPSPKYPGVFWGHNDSGNPPELFALTREGKVLAVVPVAGAPNVDWEDIALDEKGSVYVSDMGNNDTSRKQVYVYRFNEPDLKRGADAKPIRPTAYWVIRYLGNKSFDCESLVVRGGYGYLMPKYRSLKSPILYRFKLADAGRPITLEAVGVVGAVTGPVTGADISADGKYLAVLTVLGPYVIRIDGEVANAVKAPAVGHAVFVSPQMESVCFVPEGVMTATEERDIFLFTWAELGMGAPVKSGSE